MRRDFWRSPIFWGGLATFFYLVGFLILAQNWSELPPGQPLSLNELGDLLSGLAAPLAFVWLVVAVFLQRDELGAQREQLEQQREELRLAREQLEAQARELREQSASLRRQESIMTASAAVGLWKNKLNEILRNVAFLLENSEYFIGVNAGGRKLFAYTDNAHKKMIANDQFEELSEYLCEKISYGNNRGWQRIPDLSHVITEMESVIDSAESEDIAPFASVYKLPFLLASLKGMNERAT